MVRTATGVIKNMSDNFIKQTFGLNIKVPDKTLKQFEKTAGGTVSGIWEPLFNFIDENQNVFTGNVSMQIAKYNAMMYNIGAVLRADSTNGGFDVKG